MSNKYSFLYLLHEEAERLAGKRLDRRRKYLLHDHSGEGNPKVCYIGWITLSCSGCFENGEYGDLAHNYPWDEKACCHIGGGCEECGYTGKRRWPVAIEHDAPVDED